MAEPLKTFFSPALTASLAAEIQAAWPGFPDSRFLAAAAGLDELELLDRARRLAAALRACLPDDVTEALGVLVRSLGPELVRTEHFGMAPFRYLPHVIFVSEHGLADFDAAMEAQHALTRRFSAEFSLRTFVAHDPPRALGWLERWVEDENPHVRRLVSEGTRPRLPWAPRLRLQDWRPIHALLHRLVDDPTAYVRRSVANHVGDVYKDDPAAALALCRRWAAPERLPLIRHALRSAIKANDPEALALVGTGETPEVTVRASFAPEAPRVGGHVDATVTLEGRRPQRLTVDLAVRFLKPSGGAGRKVFRLAVIDLDGSATLRKRIQLHQMTTRTHVPGWHAVEVQINGQVVPVGGFELRAELSPGERAGSGSAPA